MHIHARNLCLSSCLLTTAILGVAAAPSRVSAQALTVRLQCTNHGPNVVEPFGEAAGQSLLAAEATCSIHGGPMDGAVETQHNIWRYDKGSGTLLSGQSVARKPGALSAAQVLEGALTFQMAEGRVTGWTASGRARITMAAGAAATLAGRSLNWIATPTGPRSYIVQLSYGP